MSRVLGSSLSNPIQLFYSSQGHPSSSQIDQLLSSSQSSQPPSSQLDARAAPAALSTISSGIDPSAGLTSGTPRFRWSAQNEYDFIKAIKDNLCYQTALLPGHAKATDDASSTSMAGKLTKASILRAISVSVFRDAKQLSSAQMQQKLTGLIDTYRKVLKTETITGQGLLLSEMTSNSQAKTMRKGILDRHPCDQDDGVTGGRSPYSQARPRGVYDDEMDDGSVDDLAAIDPRLLRADSSSPDVTRSSVGGRRPSNIFIPERGSSSSLPYLADLASQSLTDRQRSGAVKAAQSLTDRQRSGAVNAAPKSASSLRDERDRSPAPTVSSSRAKVDQASRDKDKKTGKGKGRNSNTDAFAEQLGRNLDEDRRLRLEREETKRRRLDVRAQQIQMQANEPRVQLHKSAPAIWSTRFDLGIYVNHQVLNASPVLLRDGDIITFPQRRHDLKTAEMRAEEARGLGTDPSSDAVLSDSANIHAPSPLQPGPAFIGVIHVQLSSGVGLPSNSSPNSSSSPPRFHPFLHVDNNFASFYFFKPGYSTRGVNVPIATTVLYTTQWPGRCAESFQGRMDCGTTRTVEQDWPFHAHRVAYISFIRASISSSLRDRVYLA
ncbi:unnamed protein product [Tilletia controversa]|nr:unnamed protein product [Tilletia controversa]CAD6973157.1 unnamed protein product [Tilletia controversa]